ncbi:MAG: C4-dicarboxylate ABC transporter substrate-binding protein [Proteobacteria bacterium]|nr:C4-dicarboxylate ABC transporter substrate-binding protein [Pseudomonadota bacterium]
METVRSVFGFRRLQLLVAEVFGLGPGAALAAILVAGATVAAAATWFSRSAPPRAVTITAGPTGSSFHRAAERYAKVLKRSGIKVLILPSDGSIENLKRLASPAFDVDLGFVQGGVSSGTATEGLMSLGTVNNLPLLIFYRGEEKVRLSQFSGKRLEIGEDGSGVRALSLKLLAANGIEAGGPTTLGQQESDDAVDDFLQNRADVVFLMGDSAPADMIRKLMRSPAVRLFGFSQADGYVRRFNYLTKVTLPQGALDFGKDVPAHDVHLVGPAVELIARQGLHPAISDLLLDAAREIHGGGGLFRKLGDFPVLLEREFPLSPDAVRFTKSGKGFFYRYLPFRFAGLVNRVLVMFLPLFVLLVPGLRLIPALYRWRMNFKIYRWYRDLLRVEYELLGRGAPVGKDELLKRLDSIESTVKRMKVPASFADQFYLLRGNIDYVRARVTAGAAR